MTFVCKEYEDKKTMNTAKNKVFIKLLLEKFYLVGKINFCWEGG